MDKKNTILLPNEQLRIEAKKLAEEVRLKYCIKGLTDIFKIIESSAMLIRKPLSTKAISGFSTFLENTFVVFINSSFTLGHEIFTGAHELYHINYDTEILKRNKLIIDDNKHEIDIANVFAAEFLMPEDLVKEMFNKLANVPNSEVELRHVVRMMDYFRVSYSAMLKRLYQLKLCNEVRREYLRQYGEQQYKDSLINVMQSEGSDMALIEPSNEISISSEYLDAVKENYARQKISFGSLNHVLKYLDKTPEHFSLVPPNEEDMI